MATVTEALNSAAKFLKTKGIETARLDAELLLAHVLKTTREELLLHQDVFLEKKNHQQYQSLINRRAKREPVARIIGVKEFWSLPFKLNNATLVPRPDSETLIEAVLKNIEDKSAVLKILDLGTGSGCLLLALLSELPNAKGLGADASEQALEAARENAEALGLDNRAGFALWNWNKNQPVSGGPYDIVLSNPPYIPDGDIEGLPDEVRNFDPVSALDGGKDGLDDIRKLLRRTTEFLKKGGGLYIEIGDGQAVAVIELFEAAGFRDIHSYNDLAGKIRVVSGWLG